jgi:hypothetical protein
MSRKAQSRSRRPNVTGRRKSLRSSGARLDRFANETLRLFVRAMIRGGYSGTDLVKAVKSEVAANPPDVHPTGRGSRLDFDDAAHVLTLWSRDPDYIEPNGSLRPIRARGPAPSVEALVTKITPPLTFEEAWSQLERTSTLQQIGELFVPRREAIIHLADPQQLSSHNLRVLNSALHTLEHNFTRGLEEPWYERSAQQAAFPVSAVTSYLEDSIQRGMEFLKAEDAVTLRLSHDAPPTEPRCRVSVNLFYTVLDAQGDDEHDQDGS